MGYKKGYIEQILNGKNAISENVEWRLRKYYPELNMDWLMHGNGEMEEPVKMQNAVSMVEEAGVKYEAKSKSVGISKDLALVLLYLQRRIDDIEEEMRRLTKEKCELEAQKVSGVLKFDQVFLVQNSPIPPT